MTKFQAIPTKARRKMAVQLASAKEAAASRRSDQREPKTLVMTKVRAIREKPIIRVRSVMLNLFMNKFLVHVEADEDSGAGDSSGENESWLTN